MRNSLQFHLLNCSLQIYEHQCCSQSSTMAPLSALPDLSPRSSVLSSSFKCSLLVLSGSLWSIIKILFWHLHELAYASRHFHFVSFHHHMPYVDSYTSGTHIRTPRQFFSFQITPHFYLYSFSPLHSIVLEPQTLEFLTDCHTYYHAQWRKLEPNVRYISV